MLDTCEPRFQLIASARDTVRLRSQAAFALVIFGLVVQFISLWGWVVGGVGGWGRRSFFHEVLQRN